MNQIHPTALVNGDVQFGTGNRILPYTVLEGPLVLGNDNVIGPHAVIGTPGEDTRNRYYDCLNSPIEIGSGNIIREFVGIQKPAYGPLTKLGDRLFLMTGTYVPHDVHLEDDVTTSALVKIGGLVKVLKGATLGMGCSINQYCVIGQYAMVATNAPTMKCVKPFARYIPNRSISVNEYAISKFGFEDIAEDIRRYVLRGDRPTSAPLRILVAHFDELVAASGRATYLT